MKMGYKLLFGLVSLILVAYFVVALSTSNLGNLNVAGNMSVSENLNITGNLTVTGNISTRNSLIGDMNWFNLKNYPLPCAAQSYLTTLDDTITCTTPTEFWKDTGDNTTGNYNITSGNFTVGGNINATGVVQAENFTSRGGIISYNRTHWIFT